MGNRVVKFRGKRVDNGEWVHGNFVLYKHMGEVKHIIVTDWAQVYVNSHYVIPETVGQYTGLYDRDGVEIYEGDVMHNRSIIPQWDKDLIDEIQAVVLIKDGMTRIEGWNENGYIGEEINRAHYGCLLLSPEIFEIIGNIHDNPELLEEKK